MLPDRTDQNAFVQAAFSGDLEVVRAFLTSGVDVNGIGDLWNPLHAAIENLELEAIRLLLGAGADPDLMVSGFRPLHHAIDTEADGALQTFTPGVADGATVKLLLDAGADANATDERGKTPLQWAIEWHHKPAIEYLRNCGAV